MTTLQSTVSEEKAQIFFLFFNKGFAFEIFFQLTYSVPKMTGILTSKEKNDLGKGSGVETEGTEASRMGWIRKAGGRESLTGWGNQQ